MLPMQMWNADVARLPIIIGNKNVLVTYFEYRLIIIFMLHKFHTLNEFMQQKFTYGMKFMQHKNDYEYDMSQWH